MYSLASIVNVKSTVSPGVNVLESASFCIRTSSIVTVWSSVTTTGLVAAVPVNTPEAETRFVSECSGMPSRVEVPLLLSRFEPCGPSVSGTWPLGQDIVFSNNGMPATYLISVGGSVGVSVPTFQVTAV